MNAIRWTNKALKQMRKFPARDSAEIVRETRALATFPVCANVKALKNHKHQYRLRVGRYRVFFNFDGVVSVVYVEEVKKRDERTY